jgi:hypothetical protein
VAGAASLLSLKGACSEAVASGSDMIKREMRLLWKTALGCSKGAAVPPPAEASVPDFAEQSHTQSEDAHGL